MTIVFCFIYCFIFNLKVIQAAFNALKQSTTNSYYRKQAWTVLHCYLSATLKVDENRNVAVRLLLHNSYQDQRTVPRVKPAAYKSIHKIARQTHQTALTGINLNKIAVVVL